MRHHDASLYKPAGSQGKQLPGIVIAIPPYVRSGFDGEEIPGNDGLMVLLEAGIVRQHRG